MSYRCRVIDYVKIPIFFAWGMRVLGNFAMRRKRRGLPPQRQSDACRPGAPCCASSSPGPANSRRRALARLPAGAGAGFGCPHAGRPLRLRPSSSSQELHEPQPRGCFLYTAPAILGREPLLLLPAPHSTQRSFRDPDDACHSTQALAHALPPHSSIPFPRLPPRTPHRPLDPPQPRNCIGVPVEHIH